MKGERIKKLIYICEGQIKMGFSLVCVMSGEVERNGKLDLGRQKERQKAIGS